MYLPSKVTHEGRKRNVLAPDLSFVGKPVFHTIFLTVRPLFRPRRTRGFLQRRFFRVCPQRIDKQHLVLSSNSPFISQQLTSGSEASKHALD